MHKYENGIYELTHSYHLMRAKDMRLPNQVYNGAFVYVTNGVINAKTSWLLQVDHSFYVEFPEISFTSVINSSGVKKGLVLYYTDNGIYEWNELPSTSIEPIDYNIVMNLKPQVLQGESDEKVKDRESERYLSGSVTIPIGKTVQLGEYRCVIYTDNRDWCCTSLYIVNSSLFYIYEDSTVSNNYESSLRLYKSSKNTLKIRYVLPYTSIKSIKLSVRFISV
jgi:hypothetical protein